MGRPVLYFEPGAEVRLGSGFVCRSGVAYSIDNLCCSKIVVNRGARLAIGNNSGISNVMIQCHKAISIGNNVNIGAGCMVFDTDFHSTLWQVRRNRDEDAQRCATAPVTIGDDVFIGARCIIGKGITIGNKAMVAAGSVVTKSIPQGELWGGAPARFIRKTSCL